jgi:hypothetical protein
MPDLRLLYPQGSYLSPTVYPHEDEADRLALEASLNHWVNECEAAKWPIALRLFTNIAFLMGNHYPAFTWNMGSNELFYSTTNTAVTMPTGVEHSIPKTVDNKMIRPYQLLISLLTEIKPEPRVTPASRSPEDEDTAEIAQIIHDLKWERMKMAAKLRQTGSYLGTMGTSIAEVTIGETAAPTRDPVYELVDKKNPLTGEEQAEPQEAGDQFAFQKDVRANIWTPFHFQPDPGATEDGDSMEWCYRHHFADIGWIKESFAVDEPGFLLTEDDTLGEDAGVRFPIYWYERIKDMIEHPEGWTQFSGRIGQVGSGFAPNQTLLRVWDCKPNAHYPRGRTLIQAGEKLIYAGDARAWSAEYPQRWHKYAVCRYVTVSGRFWGLAMISTLIANQKTINAIDSLEQLARELGTIGQWLRPRQANVQDGVLGGIPATVIDYTATPSGGKPEKVRHDPLPGEYFVKREQCEKSIELLGGTESFLAANAPSALRSGPVMDMMQKRERQYRSPTLQDFSEYLETIGTNILLETALGMDDQAQPEFIEQIRQAARDRSSHVAVVTFSRANLLANVNVKMDIASELLRSPEAKQQKAIEAAQYAGQLLSRTDMVKLFSIMGLDEFGLQDSSDYKRAKRMVSVVTSGSVGAMEPWPGIDDPEVFQQLLKQEIQSDRMITYPPEVQQELGRLHQMYSALVQQQQLAQMQQMMLMQQAGQKPQGPQAGGKQKEQSG